MAQTYCKHCINSCKTLDVKNNCPKYKIEDMSEIRKTYNPENSKKINWLDYGIENDNIVKIKEI